MRLSCLHSERPRSYDDNISGHSGIVWAMDIVLWVMIDD